MNFYKKFNHNSGGGLDWTTRDVVELFPFNCFDRKNFVWDLNGIYDEWCRLIDSRRKDGDFR